MRTGAVFVDVEADAYHLHLAGLRVGQGDFVVGPVQAEEKQVGVLAEFLPGDELRHLQGDVVQPRVEYLYLFDEGAWGVYDASRISLKVIPGHSRLHPGLGVGGTVRKPYHQLLGRVVIQQGELRESSRAAVRALAEEQLPAQEPLLEFRISLGIDRCDGLHLERLAAIGTFQLKHTAKIIISCRRGRLSIRQNCQHLPPAVTFAVAAGQVAFFRQT